MPVDGNIFPVHFKEIQVKQAKDRDLRQKIKINPSHFLKTVEEQVKIVTCKNRIHVQNNPRTRIMKWHHHYLCHPGEARMHKTLASTLYWEMMGDEIRQFVKQCPTCQNFKQTRKKKYNKYHYNSLGYCTYWLSWSLHNH